MRPEYDFSPGVRGKHFATYRAGTNVVFLEPDVAKAFNDSASVNQALRLLLQLARTNVPSEIQRDRPAPPASHALRPPRKRQSARPARG
jgi:hypothetical protein